MSGYGRAQGSKLDCFLGREPDGESSRLQDLVEGGGRDESSDDVR